jgi:outer membrane receptor for ferrienterochelin and colicins
VLFLIDGERMAGETVDNVDYTRMNLDNVGRI